MKLFTVPQAAEMLGVRQKTLRDWIWKKRIDVVRNGARYVRISDTAIQQFIENHTVPADLGSSARKASGSVGRSEHSQVQRP